MDIETQMRADKARDDEAKRAAAAVDEEKKDARRKVVLTGAAGAGPLAGKKMTMGVVKKKPGVKRMGMGRGF